jgi:hypothetical protein
VGSTSPKQSVELVGEEFKHEVVVAISTDSLVDFKRQITDLLIKVKLTRQTIKDTLNGLKKLRIEESC